MNIREELKDLKDISFIDWYTSLSKNDRLRVDFVLMKDGEYKHDILGEAIHTWISHHGSLDLNIPEKAIIDFYLQKIR